MDRIIEVKVGGNYIRKDKKTAGVRGEYEVAILRIEFDESWDEYEKRITFWDAKGLNPTFRALDATRLENHTQSKRVFLIPIPEKPMSEAGEMTFVIDGFVSIYNQDGSVERKKQRSMADKLEVKYAPVSADAGEPTTPEATIVDQMMSELGRIEDKILEAVDAKEDILNMTVSSETLTPDEVAFVIRSDHDGVPHLHFGLPKGDTGDSGVHIGDEAPSDPVKNVWISPDDGMNLQTLSQDEDLNELMTSIKAFGAVGDGVSNDTEALKAAARYGKAVYFPKGTYLLFEQIDMTNNINWIGEGEGSVIKLMPSDQSRPIEENGETVYCCDMIHHEPKSDGSGYSVSIQGMVFDTNKSGYINDVLNNGSSNADHTICLYLHSPSTVYLKNVKMTGCLTYGCYIHGSEATDISVSNCIFDDSGKDDTIGVGLYLENVDGARITNCEISNNRVMGLELQNSNGAVISNILSYNNLHGVFLSNANCNVITGVLCSYNARGLALWAGSKSNAISGLVTENCEFGVLFGDSTGNIISGWNSANDDYRYAVSYGDATKEITGTVFGVSDTDASMGLRITEENKDLFKIQFIGG